MMMTMLRHHEYDDYADDDYDGNYIWEPELVHRQQDVHLAKCSS